MSKWIDYLNEDYGEVYTLTDNPEHVCARLRLLGGKDAQLTAEQATKFANALLQAAKTLCSEK